MIDHQVAGTTVVALNGDFDQSQHDRLDDAFAAALGSSLVVLDLERTRYFDSTVLSCLIRLHTTMLERGGQDGARSGYRISFIACSTSAG